MSQTGRSAITIGAAAAGMVLFALFAHQRLPWAAIAGGGLIVTALAMATGQRAFGVLGHFSTTTLAFTLLGAGIGAAAGLWHRHGLGLPLMPSAGVEWFVVIACFIGAAEELVYRGWLFGQARAFGWPAAVVLAAVTHAAYKTALFAWPASPVAVDLWALLWLTTAGGLVLSLLREWSGSVLPAVAAHVAFDFVVYRGLAGAPWWVWR